VTKEAVMSILTDLKDLVESINDRLGDRGTRVKVGDIDRDGVDFILNFKVIAQDENQDDVERILNRVNDRLDNDSKDINFNDETPGSPNVITDTFQLKYDFPGNIDLFDI
jgi:hypothetical protein